MKKCVLLLAAGLGSMAYFPVFAENETLYDPETQTVTIPNIILKGNPGGTRYQAVLKRDSETGTKFTLIQVKQADKIDKSVEKYLTIQTGFYGQAVKMGEGDEDYLEGVEVRLYPADKELTDENLLFTSSTDKNGVYQIGNNAIKTGESYQICFKNTFPRNSENGAEKLECATASIGENAGFRLQRCDYEIDLFEPVQEGRIGCKNIMVEPGF